MCWCLANEVEIRQLFSKQREMQREIHKVDASVNENSLRAALVVCLLFERIANDPVNDIQVYSLFAVFIRQHFIR